MITIVLRCLIIYVVVLLVFRLMGKRQLGQMQPFELVLTLIIADLATIPMAEVSVPVFHGIVPLLTLVIIHFLLTLITRSSTTVSKIISGKPVIIINPEGIDYSAMKKLNLSIDDLIASLRECGYFSIDQVQYAIMETNGKISVMPKAANAPVTNEVQGNDVEESFIPLTLISEGKFMEENLRLAALSRKQVENFLCQKGIKSIKKVLVFTREKTGKCYLQLVCGSGQTFVMEECS